MKYLRRQTARLMDFLNRSDGSLTRKLVRSGFWVSFTSIGVTGLSLVRSVALARLLSPEMFGIMNIAMIVVRAIDVVSQSGVSAALIHRKESFESAKNTAFTLLVGRGFLLSFIVIMLAPYVADFYEHDVLESILIAISFSFILTGATNINVVAHEKELDFRRLAYLTQTSALINTIVIITLAYFLRDVWALAIGNITAAALGAGLSYVYIAGKPKFSFDRQVAKDLFKYGKYITGVSIALFIATEVDNAIIGKLLGAEALGYYTLAYMLANLPATHISRLGSKIMFPMYSKLQDDLPALRATYLKVIRLTASVAIVFATVLFVLAKDLILVVYGEKWLSTAAILQILSLFGAIRSLTSLNGFLLNGIGKPKGAFYITLIRLILLLALIFPLAQLYGINGVAVAVTVPLAIQLIAGIRLISTSLQLGSMQIVKAILPAVMHSVVIGGLLMVVMRYIQSSTGLGLLLLISVAAAVYFALNWKGIKSLIDQAKGRGRAK